MIFGSTLFYCGLDKRKKMSCVLFLIVGGFFFVLLECLRKDRKKWAIISKPPTCKNTIINSK